MLLLAVAVLADRASIPFLVVIAVALGTGEAVGDSAGPAMLPDLVSDEELEEANSQLEAAELIAEDLTGPPIGGALFAIAPAVPFVIDAATFAGSAGIVSRVESADSHLTARVPTSVRHDLAEGLREMWRNVVLRTTGAVLVVLSLSLAAAMAPFVLYATGPLDVSEAGFGVILSIGALGGIVGARLAPRLIARSGPVGAFLLAAVGGAVGLSIMAVEQVLVVCTGYAVVMATLFVGRGGAGERSAAGPPPGRSSVACRVGCGRSCSAPSSSVPLPVVSSPTWPASRRCSSSLRAAT